LPKHFNNQFGVIVAGQINAAACGGSTMPSSTASRASLRPLWRRFRRNRRGSTVVEFALIAPVFFALLFAILESALFFFADQTLESVAQNSSRMILTGQAQTAGYNEAQFKAQYICPTGSLASVLFNCANVYIDVQSYPAFSNITINSQINSCNFVPPTNYSPGNPGDIVVVRLFYQWQLYVTGFGFNISNLCGNQKLLAATVAFQNEP
jgi:Flp pilus assembly protein TadG